ncbi:MAG: ribonuclease III [Patescibacteria group bacterium]|jgi:ribonuclease-3
MPQDYTSLEERIGAHFKNTDLLTQAFVHRSYLNENPTFALGHNERLEFLGDAVLELVVTEYLYNHYDNSEGELTNWRAALVNATMLARVAEEMDMEPFLLLSRGESRDGSSKARQSILANTVESVIGALYLDQGYEPCRHFISIAILKHLDEILDKKLYRDPKSSLQEEAQARMGATPAYRVLDETGPDHKRTFVIGVYIGEQLVAKGHGTSKQEAQVAAAEGALKEKGW